MVSALYLWRRQCKSLFHLATVLREVTPHAAVCHSKTVRCGAVAILFLLRGFRLEGVLFSTHRYARFCSLVLRLAPACVRDPCSYEMLREPYIALFNCLAVQVLGRRG